MNKNLMKYFVFTFFGVRLFTSTLTPFFTEVGHLSHIQIQFLQSFLSLWMFGLEIPTGGLADKMGRKVTLALGALMDVIAILVMAFCHTFAGFLVAQFLFAIGFSLISGADDALVYDTLAEEGKTAEVKNIFGKAHAIHLLGMFIAAFVGSFIASKYGLTWPVILSVIPYAIAFCVALSMHEPKVHKIRAQAEPYLKTLKSGLHAMRTNKALRLLVVDGILVDLAVWFVFWLYPAFLQQLHAPLLYFGVFQAVSLAAEIGVVSNFVRLEKLFKSGRNFLIFCALVTAWSFFGLAIAPNMVTLLLFVIFAGGFGHGRFELLRAYFNHQIDSTNRATVLSTISMLRRLGVVLLNPLIGFLMDRNLGIALILLGLLPLVSLAIKHDLKD